MALEAVGSNPITHPIKKSKSNDLLFFLFFAFVLRFSFYIRRGGYYPLILQGNSLRVLLTQNPPPWRREARLVHLWNGRTRCAPTECGGERRLCGLKGEPLIHRKRSPFSAGEGFFAPLRRLCVIHNARFEPARHPRALAKDLARICCFVVGTGVLDCPF